MSLKNSLFLFGENEMLKSAIVPTKFNFNLKFILDLIFELFVIYQNEIVDYKDDV